MGKPINQTYRLSTTFDAPIDYVLCTDYQEDDPKKYLGSKNTRKMLEKSAERVVWVIVRTCNSFRQFSFRKLFPVFSRVFAGLCGLPS